jgi:hypothetical protein
MIIKNLCVAITFHYNPKRFKYLEEVTSSLDSLAEHVKLFVITNQHENIYLNEIRNYIKVKNFKLVRSGPLAHPYLLTWQHLEILKSEFQSDSSISHFMYLEDDIKINPRNISYWLEGRENLRKYGLIPAFLRYEVSGTKFQKCASASKPIIFKKIPKIKIENSYFFLDMAQPYQAMYLLDRELAKEHLFDNPLISRETIWGIRETAASGLTFVNIPKGFSSRVVLGVNINTFSVDSDALIHHLPNNYVHRRLTEYGKIPVQNFIQKNRNLYCLAIDTKILILRSIWKMRKIRVKYRDKLLNMKKRIFK